MHIVRKQSCLPFFRRIQIHDKAIHKSQTCTIIRIKLGSSLYMDSLYMEYPTKSTPLLLNKRTRTFCGIPVEFYISSGFLQLVFYSACSRMKSTNSSTGTVANAIAVSVTP